MTPDLDAAIAPVADAFDDLGVSYYLAGSVVSSLHGVARATADVDVVAALPGRHAAALVDRLGDDYYADVDTIRDALAHRAMFNVIHQPTMLKVDVYACTSEFDQSALARRTADTLLAEPGARRFWIATAEDIVLHKLHWFRVGGDVSDRQWGDILGVLRIQRAIDRAFLRTWAERLRVSDLLERALSESDR